MRNIVFALLFMTLGQVSYAARKPITPSGEKGFNRFDISIAQTLRQLMQNPKSSFNDKHAKQLQKNSKRSTIFSHNSSLFHIITRVTKYKSPISTYNQCTLLKQMNAPLTTSLIPWCHQNVIKKFLSSQLKNIKRDYYARHFFSKISLEALQQKKFLKSLFSTLRSKKETHKALSENFLSLLITENKMLPSSLASLIYISPRYEDFLRIKDKTASHPSQSFIRSQLSKMRRQYYRASKQKDFVKLKKISHQALAFLQDNYEDFRSYDLKTLLFIGQAFQKLNYIKQAQKYYKQLYLLGKTKDSADNPFVFPYLWSFIKEEDYKGALNALYKNDIIDQLEHYPLRLKFWIAYVFQKNNEYKIAHYIYSRIIENSPLTFYATMADGQLEYNKNSFAKKIIHLTKRTPSKRLQLLNSEVLRKIREINLWHYIGHSQYAQKEISTLLSGEKYSLGKKEAEIRKTRYLILDQMLSFLRSEKLYLPIFRTVFQNIDAISPESLKSVIKYLFPFEYYSKISKLTERANPIVILSLIRQESGFNPNARSAPGARGLMQIMPKTAEDLDIFNIKDLYNPKKNIKAGIKYFEYLLETFDSNLVYALASYNAGPHRVKNWKNTIFKSRNPLIMIENIPYRETRKYVKLIYRNVYFYNLLHKI